MLRKQLHQLETFANQIALAVDRAQLATEAEAARLREETERLRSSLLSSVSHDLRTPLATIIGALTAILDPAAASANLRRLARQGGDGRFGFYEAIDYRPRSRMVADTLVPAESTGPAVVHAFFAHHQGMSLVALANIICQDRFVKRFHDDPRVQATELLLQERVPREAILSEPRPSEGATVAPSIPVLASRRFRSGPPPFR